MELVPEGAEGMELVPEAAPVMGEVLQPEQEANLPAVAAGEVDVITEQPEAAGRWFPALLGSRRNIGAEATAEAEPARDDAVGSVEVAGKLAGRPPPPAPADLYTGPRSDGLLSTGEISGDYSAAYICDMCPTICNSMTVVPHGPDAIETWRTGCSFCPCFGCIGPMAGGEVRTRNPGTNAFHHWQYKEKNVMTFSADGMAKVECGDYKKRPGSQKRAFQKVDARDLAGRWCHCCCSPGVPVWPFSGLFCTTKKALDEDRYEESGRCGFLLTLCLPLIPHSSGGPHNYTRVYVNSHPTNGFAFGGSSHPMDVLWYRDPGCAGGFTDGTFQFSAKKLC